MAEYGKDYRTLSVWECFEVRGKFCHDKNYESMMRVTGSSNRGHGLCCKPDYNGEHCGPSDQNHDCSQPAENYDESDSYNSIATSNLNFQMFAFNPTTN